MKENTNRTNLSLKLDCGLVSFLKTQENHKLSRYDAFVWLVEHILDSDVEDCGKPSSAYQDYLVRYTELAKTWHWSRPTVQKFIEGLEAMSVIIKKKHVNAFALSLTDESTIAGSHTDFTTTHPTTEPMLASQHSQPSSMSLLKPTRGKRKSNRGKE
mgnify:FL=1|jgi:hypothetical protein